VALLVAVAAFIGATVLEAPWLRFVGLAALALVVLSHEAWRWRGAGGRQWLVMVIALALVMFVAFVVESVSRR
jgi:hypothetical protein